MRKGLESLLQSNKVNFIINEILSTHEFPELFKLFLQFYEVGEKKIMRQYGYFTDDLSYQYYLTNYCLENNKDDQIEHFFSVEKIIDEFQNYKNMEDDWNEEGFMQIGYMEYQDIILLGMKPENNGEIWLFRDNPDANQSVYDRISDDIFSFARNLKEILIVEKDEIYTENLYKNWREKFWRIDESDYSKGKSDSKKGQLHKSGLELLKQRTDCPDSLRAVQKKLPSKMSLFLECFNNGSYQEMFGQSEYVTLPNVSKCFIVRSEWFKQKYFEGEEYDNSFDHLLSLDEIEKELKEYQNKVEKWHKEGFVKIGFMSYWDIILLGVEEHNLDEIWVFGETIPTEKPYKFSSNIFDFFKNVEQFWSDEDLKGYTNGKVEGKDLYKNWGESFWRIKSR